MKIAKKTKIFVASDSQSSSQIGNISRFKGMDLLTPTEREARISMHNREDGLVFLAESLRKESKAKNILLKLGAEGLLIHSSKTGTEEWFTDRLKALNIAPQDMTGAGDSLLITSAMVLASKGSIWEAAFCGSVAAAIEVGRVGNIPIKFKDILSEIKKLEKNSRKCVLCYFQLVMV